LSQLSMSIIPLVPGLLRLESVMTVTKLAQRTYI